MLLSTAQTAAVLATAIAAANTQINAVTAALNNNAVVSGGALNVNDPVMGNMSQVIALLTVAESATVFNSMLTILNARVSAWNATLSGM